MKQILYTLDFAIVKEKYIKITNSSFYEHEANIG